MFLSYISSYLIMLQLLFEFLKVPNGARKSRRNVTRPVSGRNARKLVTNVMPEFKKSGLFFKLFLPKKS